MAVADVMLRIGSSLGPGGLASLQAGVQMVVQLGKAVIDTAKELDNFATVMRRTDMEMVNYADSAARGQIDTLELMKAQQKLAQAGAKVTSEQFKILAVRATDLAQATGKDATQAFTQLTDSISRGTSRALREYGIYLTEGGDITATQTKAVKAMTDGFEDMTVELDNATQRFYALNNTISTAVGVTWEALTQKGTAIDQVLEFVNEELNEFVTHMSTMTASEKDYIFSLNGIADGFSMIAADAFDALMSIDGIAKLMKLFGGLEGYKPGMLSENVRQRVADRLSETSAETEAAAAAKKAAGQGILGGKGGGGRGRGGGGGGEGSDVPGSGMSFYDVSPDDWTIGTTSATENDILGRRQNAPGQISNVTPGRFGSASDWEKTKAEIEASVDAQAELLRLDQERWSIENKISDAKTNELEAIRMQNLETQARIQLLGDEEYQAELAKVKEEQRNLQEAERRAMIDADRFDALTFSGEFTATWVSNLDMISARVDEFKDQLQLVGQTWTIMANTARQTSLIAGTAIGDMIEDSRIAVLVESTLKAALATADAVEAFASEQYLKGALYTTAAVLYTASAVKAGVDIGKGVGNSKSGYTGAASHSSFAPQYNGGYMQGRDSGPQEHVFRFIVDDRGLFTIVKEGNNQARRAGEPSFKIERAA